MDMWSGQLIYQFSFESCHLAGWLPGHVIIRSADHLDNLTYLQLISNITEFLLDRINTLLGLVDGDTMSDINKLKVELESAVYMVSTALIKVSTTFFVPVNFTVQSFF
jgi:hypothetical protein